MKLYLKAKIASSRSYEIPKDPILCLYDFYALSLVTHRAKELDIDLESYVKDAEEKLIDYLHRDLLENFKQAVYWRAIDELKDAMQHTECATKEITERLEEKRRRGLAKVSKVFPNYELLFDKNTIKPLPDLSPVLYTKDPEKAKEIQEERANIQDNNIKAQLKLLGNKGLLFCETVHEYLSMGGEKDPWYLQVVPGYKRLLSANSLIEKVIAIDHAYDVCHHNGSIWDHFDNKYHEMAFPLQKALNNKYKLEDEFELYHKVSGQLRGPFAKAVHALTGKTLETNNMPKDPLGLQKFTKGDYGYKEVDGWYELPNGIQCEFENAAIELIWSWFSVGFDGIKLINGAVINGEWPGGFIGESENYIKPRGKKLPIKIKIKKFVVECFIYENLKASKRPWYVLFASETYRDLQLRGANEDKATLIKRAKELGFTEYYDGQDRFAPLVHI